MKSYLKILNDNEKKEIIKKLNSQFGISEINGILVKFGEDRILLFQGSLNEKEIIKLERTVHIEKIGVYFAKIQNNEVRLSIEGTQLLKNQIVKNMFELNEKLAEEWMMGQDLQIKTGKKGFLVMKYKNNFLGTGKASENKIGNFIPKSRRLKYKD